MQSSIRSRQMGFTIVELLIVIVVIGILAAITIVAYNGVQDRAKAVSASSAASQIAKSVKKYQTENGTYPSSLGDIGVSNGNGTTYSYVTVPATKSFCVAAQSGAAVYSVQNNSSPLMGGCGQLTASYYSNITLSGDPVLKRSEDNINANWGTSTPDSTVPKDNFSAEWVGSLIPPVTGEYTFYANIDDNGRLYVGDNLLMDWTPNGSRNGTSNTINLTEGQAVPIKFNVREYSGNAYAKLSWSYPGQTQIIIPASAFSRS